MNKKFLFSVIPILGLFAIGGTACAGQGGVSTPNVGKVSGNFNYDPATGNFDAKGNAPIQGVSVPNTQAAAQVPAQAPQVSVPTTKVAANSVSVPPAAPAAPAPAAVAPIGPLLQAPPDAVTIDAFATLLDANPYTVIDKLDGVRNAKVDHPVGGWDLAAGANEIQVFWTGIYDGTDVTFGGKVLKYRVDGKTGVYVLQSGQSIRVPSPGASMRVVYKDASVDRTQKLNEVLGDTLTIVGPKPATGSSLAASTCVAKDGVVSAINANKTANPGLMYQKLDEIVNANSTARLRSGNAATITAKNGMTLVWVQAGQLSGQTIVSLDVHDGKMLALILKDGSFEVPYPFSGVELCSKVDPATDFLPWWGK